MTERDGTIHEIARNAADLAAWKYGQFLPKARRLALWEQHYDATLAALLVFDELLQSRARRRDRSVSAN